MTTRRYYTDPTLVGSTVITEAGDDGRPFVVLEDTLFHVKGGGQRSDVGTIAGIAVVDVVNDNDTIKHYLARADGLKIGMRVDMEVDANVRKHYARLHTAGHLVAALVERDFPAWTAKGGHHWPEEARVDFAGADKPNCDAVGKTLEESLASAIASALPVTPALHTPTLRTVTIKGFASVPCGGTHVANLGELGEVIIRKVSFKKGTLRISYDVADE